MTGHYTCSAVHSLLVILTDQSRDCKKQGRDGTILPSHLFKLRFVDEFIHGIQHVSTIYHLLVLYSVNIENKNVCLFHNYIYNQHVLMTPKQN